MEFLNEAMAAVPIGQTSLVHILIQILVGFVMGLIIAWTYKVTYRGFSYARTFMFTLVFLTTISTLIIIAIGESVARAFALAGALSIIRFRTPIKDTRDITFVFFALISGLAMGTGKLAMAVMATLVISALILLYYRLSENYFSEVQKYLLRLRADDLSAAERQVAEGLGDQVKGYELMNVAQAGEGSVELSYVVHLKPGVSIAQITQRLGQAPALRDLSTVALSDTVDF